MKAKHVLLHLVKNHHESKPEIFVHEVLQDHIRQAFSRQKLTETLKERLRERRAKEKVKEELLALEQGIAQMHSAQTARVHAIQTKIEEYKKKLGKI